MLVAAPLETRGGLLDSSQACRTRSAPGQGGGGPWVEFAWSVSHAQGSAKNATPVKTRGRLPRDLESSSDVFQSLSRVRLSATPWTTAHQASLPITHSWSLL